MRAFVALPLPEALGAALEAVQGALGMGRPVPVENMHLTLAFLDDQPEAVLAALHDGLEEIAPRPVELRVTGVDVFGGRAPRLVFAGVEKTPELEALRAAVRSAARAAGIALPRERFRPHITLARFPRHLPDGAALRLGRFLEGQGALRLPPARAECLALCASHLHPDGAVHEVLAGYPLG